MWDGNCNGNGYWDRYYMDNTWMTVGYKSMAGYTVDFRQLGCNPTAAPAKVKYGGGNYHEYLTGNGRCPRTIMRRRMWS